MPFKINQIKSDNSVVSDFDSKLNLEELIKIFKEESGLKFINRSTPFLINYKNSGIYIILKNIVYSGNPASHDRKRVQVDSKSLNFIQTNDAYIIGIYSYDKQRIFCLPNRERFIGRNTKSYTSAHIHIKHLLNAKNQGYFRNQRGDVLFTKQFFTKVLDELISDHSLSCDNLKEILIRLN